MIKRLLIKNSSAFSSVDFRANSGFNAISGVSGAGKSVFLHSILAVFGLKETNAELIETNVYMDLESVGIKLDDFGILHDKELPNEYTLSLLKKQSARYFINNQSISRRNLSKLTSNFIRYISIKDGNELDSDYMLNALDSIHIISPLDTLATGSINNTLQNLVHDYKSAFYAYKSCASELEKMRNMQRDIENLKDFATFEIDKITSINPTIGEYEKLLHDKKMLSKKEKILNQCVIALRAMDNLDCVKKCLELLDIDNSDFVSNISETRDILERAIDNLNTFDIDPHELLERISVLSDLNRRYGSEEQALKHVKEQQEKLKEYEHIEFDLANLEKQHAILESKAISLAKEISQARAERLEHFIYHLNYFGSQLRLQNIRISMDSKPISENGMDMLEIFMDSKDKSVLSAGEYNRLRLCMLCVGSSFMNAMQHNGVLILDEIDANLSGEESYGVARLLHFLSKSYQIFAISHHPFIPLLSDQHYLVYKDICNASKITLLDKEGRIKEIARIISGANLNDSVLQYAKTLLEQEHHKLQSHKD